MNLSQTNMKKWPRVAFIAHALLPGYYSTILIQAALKVLGRDWSEEKEPCFILWLSFPVMVPDGFEAAQNVWVNFYIIPTFAPNFLAGVKSGDAFRWVEKVALHAIQEAEEDNVPLWLGWGAATKNATDHGLKFVDMHPEIEGKNVSTTHGDAGTIAIAMDALERIGVGKDGKKVRLAVIGANGAIGDGLSRVVARDFLLDRLVLVGRPDRPGETKNFIRLDALSSEIRSQQCTLDVHIHQDKGVACQESNSNVVVVATTGMELLPQEIPDGAIIIDLTTPSACNPKYNWNGRVVIQSGCGQFMDISMLPQGFGHIGIQPIVNAGAAVNETGGERVLWGCTGETIALAMANRRGHIVGQKISLVDIDYARELFRRIHFAPQPPVSLGRVLSWKEIAQTIV